MDAIEGYKVADAQELAEFFLGGDSTDGVEVASGLAQSGCWRFFLGF